MAEKYQSEMLGMLYEEALTHYKMGTISKDELREYEKDCLVHETKQSNGNAHSTIDAQPVKLYAASAVRGD